MDMDWLCCGLGGFPKLRHEEDQIFAEPMETAGKKRRDRGRSRTRRVNVNSSFDDRSVTTISSRASFGLWRSGTVDSRVTIGHAVSKRHKRAMAGSLDSLWYSHTLIARFEKGTLSTLFCSNNQVNKCGRHEVLTKLDGLFVVLGSIKGTHHDGCIHAYYTNRIGFAIRRAGETMHEIPRKNPRLINSKELTRNGNDATWAMLNILCQRLFWVDCMYCNNSFLPSNSLNYSVKFVPNRSITRRCRALPLRSPLFTVSIHTAGSGTR